ncbi:hypothetical protein MMC13_001416 [Lambiella insularis]|nr:hypothetical protein [Lambiella insularis]
MSILERLQNASSLEVFLAILITISVFVFVTIIRRIFFHALSDIPGPFVAKFSTIWQLWVVITGQVGPATIALHRKYGKFVRIAYNEVSVCDPECSLTVLRRNLDKGSWYAITALPDSSLPNQMSIRSAKDEINLFKGLSAGYKLSNIAQAEPYIDDCIALFRRRLDDLSFTAQPFEPEMWFTFLFFDIVGEVTFSKRFGFLEEGRDIAHAIKNQWFLTAYLAVMGYFPWAHNYLLANPLITYLHLQPAMHVLDTVRAAIASRATNYKAHPDMLSHWTRAHAEHSDRLSARDILAACAVTVGAAADTSGAALQAFVYYLLRDASMLALLRAELAAAHLSPIPSWEETRALPVLQACIKESLRVHCPVSIGLPRIAPPGGITLHARTFPAGTVLSVNQWAMHHLGVFGPDVDAWNPRRWFVRAGEGPERLRAMEACLIPFSAGYNQCPGQHLAQMEIGKVAALMVRDYEVSQVVEGAEWRFRSHLAATPWGWPCWLRVRGR